MQLPGYATRAVGDPGCTINNALIAWSAPRTGAAHRHRNVVGQVGHQGRGGSGEVGRLHPQGVGAAHGELVCSGTRSAAVPGRRSSGTESISTAMTGAACVAHSWC